MEFKEVIKNRFSCKKYGSRGYGSRQTQSSDGSETPNHPDADNSPRPEREERRSA